MQKNQGYANVSSNWFSPLTTITWKILERIRKIYSKSSAMCLHTKMVSFYYTTTLFWPYIPLLIYYIVYNDNMKKPHTLRTRTDIFNTMISKLLRLCGDWKGFSLHVYLCSSWCFAIWGFIQIKRKKEENTLVS